MFYVIIFVIHGRTLFAPTIIVVRDVEDAVPYNTTFYFLITTYYLLLTTYYLLLLAFHVSSEEADIIISVFEIVVSD